ncbi:hypothetical protein R4Z10_14980 [Niallia sp. XMNu-256]|uniref:hypothetical protein n=1 Tax=Niallia sp. XMNu-256 TaxID=3082444 RepID=UPI0030D4C017
MKKLFTLVLLVSIPLLAGCMFPEEQLAHNAIPYQDQLQSVQTAVENFQKDQGGILPIKTLEKDTPIYHKYPIDFKRLIPEYMAEPPSNAYESGGVFQYVIVDAETKPTVKMFDLRIADLISEINLRIKIQGYPPFKDKLAENIYSIDFEKLGYSEEPFVVSPYSSQHLPIVINHKTEVYVDYRSDLYQAINNESHEFQNGDDIRNILIKSSPFVPAYSLPYTIDSETNEPVFLTN